LLAVVGAAHTLIPAAAVLAVIAHRLAQAAAARQLKVR
jgi:hypothetical protein